MTILNIRTVLLTLALATVTGCDVEDVGFGEGDISLRPGGAGILFNTSWLGSFEFGEFRNEFSTWHKDTSLTGVTVSILYKDSYYKIPLQEVWAENGQIFGKGDGQTYSGHQFDESVWSFTMLIDGDKTDVTVKIKEVTDTNNKDWKYVFKHNYKATDEYGNCLANEGKKKEKEGNTDNECLLPVCQDDPDLLGMQYEAIVTENITVDTITGDITKVDKGTQYWGCVSGAVGKTGNNGYRLETLSHDIPKFEGGVRMFRADYCGTGDSFTIVGQKLSITDFWGINSLAQNVKLEALWGEDGAVCVYQPRLASSYSLADVQDACKDLAGINLKACDASWNLASIPGTLYMSTNPP